MDLLKPIQSTQSNKLEKKEIEMKAKFDFFMKINIKLFLHVDSIKFGGHVQS